MTGSVTDQPLTVAHNQESEWYPRSIATTFNNDRVLAIQASHIVSAFWEPKGTKVSDDGELEAVAMQMTVNFWVPGKNFDIGAIEILDLIKPAMWNINDMVKVVKDRAKGKSEEEEKGEDSEDAEHAE
ncbi:hypothetical protein LCGC14_1169840 [marine sediment metagenome]|uniref:Uncharacterized protein n=1 Tax=marine sediment metagenome TaxID=412755 RepID=A0A0F9P8D4_9ZZZZ